MSTNEKTDTEYELFDRQFWIFTAIFICLILVSLSIPWILNTRHSILDLTSEASGHIGDSLGGTLGPAIAIIAAAFTFLAFWVQYKANELQMKTINKEREINNKQRELDLIVHFQKEGISMLQSLQLTEVNYSDNSALKCSKAIKNIREYARKFDREPHVQLVDFIEDLKNAIRYNHSIIEKIDNSIIEKKDKILLLNQIYLHYTISFGGSSILYLMNGLYFECKQKDNNVTKPFIGLNHYLQHFYKPSILILHKYLDNLYEPTLNLLQNMQD